MLTKLPPGKKTVGMDILSQQKANGSVDKYKAWPVAKGFTQYYGIDYHETFSPRAKLNTVHVLLSIIINQDWPQFQLDVKNVFLNGDLIEEVYMDIPARFETNDTQGKVCKMRNALYGLKQSPRAWFDRFTKVLKQDRYSQTQANHTLFVKHFMDGKITILIVYVDDILLIGNHEGEMRRLKNSRLKTWGT